MANVVAALEFLIDAEGPMQGDVFLISDDEDDGNNYRDIEKQLLRQFGFRDYRIPRIPLPRFALSACLRLAGRNHVNPNCRYDSRKIIAAGLTKPSTLEGGLKEFADWYKVT